MRPKNDVEHNIVMTLADSLTRWKNVRLALADQVLETRLHKERIQELFSRVVGRDLELNDDDWQQQACEMMIRDVIDDLSYAVERRVGAGRIYDDVEAALRSLYTTQARLLGVLPEQYDAADSPSQILRLMIERYAAKSGAGNSSDEARHHFSSLSNQFEAVEYAAANDLEQTVLLQYLWLRTLAFRTAQNHEEKADQAMALIDAPNKANISSESMFAQIRNGEQAILRQWLLTSPLE